MSIRARKTPAAPSPSGNERAEIETILRRLEELRRMASNSDLRGAYEAAIGSLDGVVYRLAMLRPPDAPKPARRTAEASVSAPPRSAPTATAATRAAAARISAARRRR
jgi:hypothetical protein